MFSEADFQQRKATHFHCHKDHAHDQRHQHVEAHVGPHKPDDGDEAQNAEHGPVVDGSIEDDEGTVAGVEAEVAEITSEADHGVVVGVGAEMSRNSRQEWEWR